MFRCTKKKTSFFLLKFCALLYVCFRKYLLDNRVRKQRQMYGKSERFLYVPSLQKGLSNQKLQMLRVVRLTKLLDRTLIIPGLNDFLYSSNVTVEEARICQDKILCHTIPFSGVFDVSKFKQDLHHHLNVSSVDISEIPRNWKQLWSIGEIMIPKRLKFEKVKETALFQRLGAVAQMRVIILNGLVSSLPHLESKVSQKGYTAQEYDATVMNAFHVNDFLRDRLSSLYPKSFFTGCSHQVNFTLALHVRAEPDMYRLCKNACFTGKQMLSWAADYFHVYQNTSIMLVLTGPTLKFDTINYLAGLGWCASKVSGVVKKEDLLHIQQAAIDYEVGKRASIFVGLRLSSFSSEMFKVRRDLNKLSWEFVKGAVVPWS